MTTHRDSVLHRSLWVCPPTGAPSTTVRPQAPCGPVLLDTLPQPVASKTCCVTSSACPRPICFPCPWLSTSVPLAVPGPCRFPGWLQALNPFCSRVLATVGSSRGLVSSSRFAEKVLRLKLRSRTGRPHLTPVFPPGSRGCHCFGDSPSPSRAPALRTALSRVISSVFFSPASLSPRAPCE